MEDSKFNNIKKITSLFLDGAHDSKKLIFDGEISDADMAEIYLGLHKIIKDLNDLIIENR